ncbi:hypothetical protein PC117_g24582 [Phytophthora cactorum]|uniref:Uncharacterized protein n=1 Tax=Phytophthora cactorum TaxID=29920 RepID=A0A8T1AVS1_9STRA|nr:hypothetical protein PC117_g24582 [Phytophthora cactorum]
MDGDGIKRLGRERFVTAKPGDHDNFCEVPEEDYQNAEGAIPLQWRSLSRGGVYGLLLDKEDDEQKLSVRD